MKRVKRFFVVLLMVVGAVQATLYYRHQRARSLALPVVAELGGRVGSITAPFGGTEYAISFAGCTLTRSDIDRLVVLKLLLRDYGYVTVSLNDATISGADRAYLQKTLPEVHFVFAEDG